MGDEKKSKVKEAIKAFWNKAWEERKTIFSVGIIVIMALTDFLTMVNLFTDLDLMDSLEIFGLELPISEITIYSLTLAVLLEGLPTFMGRTKANYSDVTNYSTNDLNISKIGFRVSHGAMLGTFGMISVLRILMIVRNGGVSSFYDVNKSSGFIVSIYLMFQPILTSCLAFVASWTLFKKDKKDVLEKKVEKKRQKYMKLCREFLDACSRLENEKSSLWSSISTEKRATLLPGEADTSVAATSVEAFNVECFNRIRQKLIDNCLVGYPSLMNMYNTTVEIELKKYWELMSEYSLVPRDILDNYSVEDIIKKYDEEHNDMPVMKWNLKESEHSSKKEIVRLINNAVVVAQYKSSPSTFRLEGDKY